MATTQVGLNVFQLRQQANQAAAVANGGKDPYAQYGGYSNYIASQQKRYDDAKTQGNVELLEKLRADSQRAGYGLTASQTVTPAPQAQQSAPVTPMAPQGTMAVGAPPPPPQAPDNTASNYINELAAARRAAQIAALDKSRNAALSNLGAEKAAIQPRYYDARNQAAAGSQQQARNFAEFMAARGGANAGANAQAEITRGMNLQGTLGSLGRQETAAYGDIERRTSDVKNAYESDVAAAESGIQAEKMNLLISDYYRAQERGDRLRQQEIENAFAEAGLTGYLKGQRTLAGQSMDWGRTVDTANLTGMFGGQQTLQSRLADRDYNYQVGRDKVMDDRYAQEFGYQLGRDKVEDEKWLKSFNYQKTQDAQAQARWKAEFDFNKVMSNAKLAQDAQQFAASQGLQWARMNQEQQRYAAEQAWQKKQYEDDQAWKQKYYEMDLAKVTPQSTGIDDYDLATVEGMFTKAGLNFKTAGPDEIKSFVAGMKSQYGWTTEEAKKVDQYLSKKTVTSRFDGQKMIAMGIRG